MADEPFSIDQLNNVSFDNDSLSGIQAYNTTPSEGGTYMTSAVQPFQLKGVSVDDPGVISVLSSDYTEGFPETFYYYEGGSPIPRYHLPTFGSIQFSNVVDGDGNPITFWVHGFTENGLFLTREEDAYWQSGNSTFARDQTGYVFGSYGINVPGGLTIPGSEFDKDASVFCFAEGTRIDTPRGPVAVEHLSAGDIVVTATGAHRPLKWVGELISRPDRHSRPWQVNPVLVKPHAFGNGMPRDIVRLSPGHSVFVDGVLVPVGHLVNGATIVQEQVERVRYFHLELDDHDVLLAAGLPCESYLDDGNRPAFLGSAGVTQLHARLDPKNWDNACAPVVADGPQLLAIRERLQSHAGSLGWQRAEDPNLIVEANGVRISATTSSGNHYTFDLPACAVAVVHSNHSVLAHVLPNLQDRRLLGVAIEEIMLDGVAIELGSNVLGEGFHQSEVQGGKQWRWTKGTAKLHLDLKAAARLEISVLMVAPHWRREFPDLRAVA